MSSAICVALTLIYPAFCFCIDSITAVIESDDPDESEDYLKGILVSAIILFVIYVVWMIVLWVFKCFRRRAGVFSGTPISLPDSEVPKKAPKGSVRTALKDPFASSNEKPNGPTANRNDLLEIAEARANAYRCMQLLRYICLFSLYGVMVGSCLMATKGINNVEQATDSGRLGLYEGSRLAMEAAALIEMYAERQKPLLEQIAAVRRDFNGFCPNVRQEICQVSPATFQLTENCDFTDIPFGEELAELDLPTIDTTVLFQELEEAQIDLLEVAADLQEYDEDIEDIEWPFKVARAFALVLLFLSVFLLVCLAHVWRKDYLNIHTIRTDAVRSTGQQRFYSGLKKWVLLPLFILFVILALVFSTVFVVISTTTSDVCADSPDATVLAFLEKNEDSISNLTYRFMVYYVDRCPPERAPLEFNERLKAILEVFDLIGQFLQSIRDSADEVAAICGPDPNSVVQTGEILLNQLCLIRDTIIGMD
jgi:hypothetical protein